MSCYVSCTLFDTLRNKFFDKIIKKCNFLRNLDVKSKILFLFNNIDPFIFVNQLLFLLLRL